MLNSVVFFFSFLFSGSVVPIYSGGVGINYGQIANNLPSPSRVALLLESLNITRVKLYDADPNVLLAFSNSNVYFIVGLGNEYLQNMTPSKLKIGFNSIFKPTSLRPKSLALLSEMRFLTAMILN